MLHHTSVQDLNSSLKCSWQYITVEELRSCLSDERRNRKRRSVIDLLTRAINRKQLNRKHQ